MTSTPCPACGRYKCFIWIQYRDIAHRMKNSGVMTAHLLDTEGVMPSQKPRVRDLFNPMYYLRKEFQKVMKAIERLTAQVDDLNANVSKMQEDIAAEHAQFSKAIAELKAASNGANNEAELNAIADRLQASIDNVKGAAQSVKAIVPDETAELPPLPGGPSGEII